MADCKLRTFCGFRYVLRAKDASLCFHSQYGRLGGCAWKENAQGDGSSLWRTLVGNDERSLLAHVTRVSPVFAARTAGVFPDKDNAGAQRISERPPLLRDRVRSAAPVWLLVRDCRHSLCVFSHSESGIQPTSRASAVQEA